MQVLLKDSTSGLYYSGRDVRTADPFGAFDFCHIDRAARCATSEMLAGMLIILNYVHPPCQLALSIDPHWNEPQQFQPN